MMDRLVFDEPFYYVPQGALEVDPVQTMRELLRRVATLEKELREAKEQASSEMRQVMLDLVSLYDVLTAIVERRGVVTNAQGAEMVRAIIGLGRQILVILKRQGVEPIATIGQPYDAGTSDIAGTEIREDLRPGTVLREVLVGYRWQGEILRKAQVIVSARSDVKPNAHGVDHPAPAEEDAPTSTQSISGSTPP